MVSTQSIDFDYDVIITPDSKTKVLKVLLAQFEEFTKIYVNTEKNSNASLIGKRLDNKDYSIITLNECRKFYDKLSTFIQDEEQLDFYYTTIKEYSNDLLAVMAARSNKGKNKIKNLPKDDTICIRTRENEYEYIFLDPIKALSVKYETDPKLIVELMSKDLAEKTRRVENIFKLLQDEWLKRKESEKAKKKKKSLIKNIVGGFFGGFCLFAFVFFSGEVVKTALGLNNEPQNIEYVNEIDQQEQRETQHTTDNELTDEHKYDEDHNENDEWHGDEWSKSLLSSASTAIRTMAGIIVMISLVLLIILLMHTRY